MAVDKLVDSAQLDSDLTSVANAIRAKSGGSSQLAFPNGFVSEIGAIPTGGEEVLYGVTGTPYVKNIIDTETINATAPLDQCNLLESIYREKATTVGASAGGLNCRSLKSIHFPRVTSITTQYFIRQQNVSTHSLESITIGSIGYPVTSLNTTYGRWFYGDCKNGCTVTVYVDAQTIADVPTNVSNYILGNSHPSGYVINVIYRNSATGEVLTS